MHQQAVESVFCAFPVLVFFVLLVAVIGGIYWYTTHCPNCNRIFTRELIKKNKAGVLPTAISGKEQRHYRCKNCGHEWDKVVYVE